MQRGEVANRILSVGSTQRAQLLSQLLEPPSKGKPLFTRLSSRGFLTITGELSANHMQSWQACVTPAGSPDIVQMAGRYNGMPVSIVSTHMGMPNMDFVVGAAASFSVQVHM
jgi:uridine phosphorylase